MHVTIGVTERQRMVEALRESEAKFRLLFEKSPDAMLLLDGDVFVDCNQAAVEMMGCASKEELLSLRPYDISPERQPDGRLSVEKARELIDRAHREGSLRFEWVHRRMDGEDFSAEVLLTAIPLHDRQILHVSLRDVTERKRAEEALRESEANLRSLLEHAANFAVYRVAVDPSNPYAGKVVMVSPSIREITGISDPYHFESWFENIHPEDLTRAVEANRRAWERGEPYSQQVRVYHPQKEQWIWVHTASTPVFDAQGNLTHFNGLIVDITEQKRAEEELREREVQFRSIFESTSDAVLIFDFDGTIVEANPAACKMYGYSYEELIGLSGKDIARSDHYHIFEDFKRQVKTSGRFSAQSVDLRKDGSPIHIEVRGASFSYKGRPHLLAVVRDVTERVEAGQILERRVEERTRELSTLLEVSHNVASTLELEPLLGLILDQLKAVVDYSGASILILEDESLAVLACRGPIPQEDTLRLRFPLERAPVNREVIRRREPVIIPDVRDDAPLARAFQQTAGEELETTFGYIRSWMGIPLMIRERVIGMLTLDHGEPDYYSSRQAELAMAFASQAALAIENAKLFEETRRRLAESQSLTRVTTALLQKLALGEVLDIVCTEAQELTGALGSTVFLLDKERGGWLRVAHSSGTASPDFDRMPIEGSLTGRAVREGKPIVSNDPAELSQGFGGGGEQPTALLAVPLRVKGSIIGALDMVSKPGGFTQEDVRVSSIFAGQAAMAIENARLYEQAQELARVKERQRLARDLHDAVTQTLFSASLIAEVLPRLWERNPDEGRRRLEELRQLTRGALAEMRTLLLELRPSALAEANLSELLRQLAESITGRARVPVSVGVEGECALPPEVKVALYRIAQEALNNVAKHAAASQAAVSLRYLLPSPCQGEGPGVRVELRISDDGRGFDPQGVPPESLGLGIMRERAEAIGAALRIKSQVGQGTQVVVAWPSPKRET